MMNKNKDEKENSSARIALLNLYSSKGTQFIGFFISGILGLLTIFQIYTALHEILRIPYLILMSFLASIFTCLSLHAFSKICYYGALQTCVIYAKPSTACVLQNKKELFEETELWKLQRGTIKIVNKIYRRQKLYWSLIQLSRAKKEMWIIIFAAICTLYFFLVIYLLP